MKCLHCNRPANWAVVHVDHVKKPIRPEYCRAHARDEQLWFNARDKEGDTYPYRVYDVRSHKMYKVV